MASIGAIAILATLWDLFMIYFNSDYHGLTSIGAGNSCSRED